MADLLKAVRDLKTAGKLHKRLLFQIRLLSLAALVLLAIVAYQVLRYGLNPWICIAIGAVMFLFGLLVFSKMNKVVWDEEKEIIAFARMDVAAFVILALYIGIEIALRSFLQFEYGSTIAATGYLFSAIGPSLLGRAIGTLIAVEKLAAREAGK